MTVLPNQLELQTLFSGFLFEAGLSSVSVKNYLSDLRHFFTFCASITSLEDPPTSQEIFQSLSKYLNLYLIDQKKNFTPQNTINRRCASIRRFSTFLASKYGLSTTPEDVQPSVDHSLPTITKILDHFKGFLENENKTHSTVKNYLSDLNHFFAWSASSTPFMDQDFENLLSLSQLSAYVTYLKLSHISTSVINRRQSSIKQFTRYCFLEKYLPGNPFEYKVETPRLAPLSWFERLKKSKNKGQNNRPPSRLAVWYQKYNSLPFTPYLHLAILVLATSAMVVFGYNQIVKQAKPSSAALPTVPRRQLSFQGRLTDSSATPITTGVDVVFKLFDDETAGTELYSTGTCTIDPDQNGIFNTLIGGGTCGSEIAGTVFTENRDVFLEVTVGEETLSPRQQIATVGYALNAETLQGYPASASATANTVPIVNNDGDIIIASASPNLTSTSGTFTVTGQALALQTTTNSGGDVIIQPDAMGNGETQVLGNTTSTDTFSVENANLTSGALIGGYMGNNTATGRLLSLTGGSVETDRFYVAASGQTLVNTTATLDNAALKIVQNGSGDLLTASASSTTKFTVQNNGNILATGTLTGLTGLTVSSGTVSLPNGEINNAEISELDWTKLQNYPAACPAGEAIQAVGDTLTCVSTGGVVLWQRTLGSLAPQNITDSLNLGAIATSSALVHLAGTAAENSWINTGRFGLGTTAPTALLDVAGDASTSGSLVFRGSNPSTIDILNGNRLDFQTSPGGDANLAAKMTLTDAGNLGIGLTDPGTTLDVTGTGRFSSTLTASNGLTQTTGTLSLTANAASVINTAANDLTITSGHFNTTATGINTTDIGQTTAGAGAFTTLTSTGITTLGNNSATVAVNSSSWDIGTTGAITGSASYNGLVVTADTGVITTGTWNAGLIPLAFGGTNKNMAAVNGGVVWTDTDSMEVTAAGVAGQVLVSNGAAAPSWSATSAVNFWQRNAGALTPLEITNALTLGDTATASALVSLPGTNNQNAFFNLGTGNVGIGTTSPLSKLSINGGLHVGGDSDAGDNNLLVDGTLHIDGAATFDSTANISTATNWQLGSVAYTGTMANLNTLRDDSMADTLHRHSELSASDGSPNPALSVDAAGNVGISTTAPTALLDVAGDASTSGSLVFRGSNPSTIDILNGNRLDFQTSPGGDANLAAKMTLLANGSLGIGTTAPTHLLAVNGNIGIVASGYLNWGATDGDSGYGLKDNSGTLQYKNSGGAWANIGSGGGSSVWSDLTAPGEDLTIDMGSFKTTFTWTGGGIFAFDTNGNVGIGTTAPVQKLHVEGNCVTADTMLTIRRRRKKHPGEVSDDDYVYDEILERIDRIYPGDEVLSLNEMTGTMEYARINKLVDMGIKDVYELVTKSGKVIRTTSEHPFLTLQTT